jgi:hypothetical protein
MSNSATKPTDAPQARDPQRTFQTAIAQIQRSGEPRSHSKIPIAARKQVPTPGDQAAEKRALTDAARALAQLWNIAPALVRRGG